MKKLLTLFFFLGTGFSHEYAYAAQNPSSHATRKAGSALLSSVALNAATATRTITLTEQDLLHYGIYSVFVSHSNTAATDVQMTCNASDDTGTTYFAVQSCAVSAGNCTSSDANWTKAVSADDTWVWRIDTLGFIRIQCVFSGTSAGGSDTVTVTGFASAQ